MSDSENDLFALTLVGEGLSLDRKVNREVAMAVFAAVMGGGMASPSAPKLSERETASPTRIPMSAREFLNDKKPANNAELIASVGHYMCHYLDQETFSNNDIKEGLRRAHEVVPKNLSRDVGKTVAAGWIEPAPGKAGQFYVTNTGIKLIETRFGRA